MIKLTGSTKASELLAKYPWLPSELAKLNSRLKVLNTPMGRLFIRNATLDDFGRKSGLGTEKVIAKLEALIEKHG